jgi:hypothetical protein
LRLEHLEAIGATFASNANIIAFGMEIGATVALAT